MKLQAIKGMRDILPPESRLWSRVEELAREVFFTHGFSEIRTPLVEPTELFVRGVGKETSMVEKQMYTFADRKGSSLTLRPEGTAPVVRAYLEAERFAQDSIAKFFYLSPMFRYENPQKGRSRQFHQIGAELLGSESSLADAELLLLLFQLFQRWGLKDLRLEINSLGCKACRPGYRKALHDFFAGKKKDLCAECQKRLGTNPLRILDCKNESCRALVASAPLVSDFWCEACLKHHREVCGLLLAGRVSFQENPRIVRGLDYYCRTAFEVLSSQLGAQDALAGGGRYDGLVQDLGGPDVAGVGFAIGMERLLLILENSRASSMADHPVEQPIFFALLGIAAAQKVLFAVEELRNLGKRIELGYSGSLKSQLRRADKLQAGRVVILGDDEVARGVAVVKEMASGKQEEVLLGRLVEKLRG